MPVKRATQDDVAALAGVTRATVSYVLTGRAESLKITPEVIDRVQKSAKKLRYLPNLAARSLAAGQSRQIGLLIPGPEFVKNYYWGPILAGVEKAALKSDYDILLLSSRDGSLDKMKNYLLQNRIDIAITLGSTKQLSGKRFPLPPISVGMKPEGAHLPSVYTVVGQAIRDAVFALKEAGVDQIVWVGIGKSSLNESATADRLRCLGCCCKEFSLSLETWILNAPHSPNSSFTVGEEIAHFATQLASSGFTPQRKMGFLCWNDLVALGLYEFLKAYKLVPGKDVSVVGFDNHFAEAALPPLASIGFNAEKLGEAAVEMAISVLEQRKNGKRMRTIPVVEVPARLIRRASLGLAGASESESESA